MSKPLHKAYILAAAFITATLFLSTPAFATIVYTNGQDRTTPITSTDTLQVDNTDVATQSGVISGVGTAITKTGAGTLTLSATNTYTGGTIINGGTVLAQTNAALGAGTVALNNGTLKTGSAYTLTNNITVAGTTSTINVDSNNNLFSGNISGTGQLNISGFGGGGELNLTGVNTYTGGTIVLALATAGSNSAFGTGTIDIRGSRFGVSADVTLANNIITNANGSSIYDYGYNAEFSGTVSGSGYLRFYGTNANNSSFTLSGNNTYAQGTQANNITLKIYSANNLPVSTDQSNFSDLILNNATLKIMASVNLDRTIKISPAGTIDTNGFDSTFSGVISDTNIIGGRGALIKSGAGTLTLSAHNNYSDGTIIRAGTLQMQNSEATGLGFITIENGATLKTGASFTIPNQIQISNGATATINTNGNNNTFNNFSSSSGNLVKSGAGTLTLIGNNQYFGGTTINNGKFQVGDNTYPGIIAGDVNVTGGTLTAGSDGAVRGNVTNGANASLAQLSTLAVNRNYTQSSTGTLAIQVSPDSAGKLNVGGTASLNGTLALSFDAGTYTTKTYTLLTAANVSGTFTTVTGTAPSSSILWSVNYTPTAVTLDLIDTAPPTTPTPPPAPTGVSELGSSISSTVTSSNQASATIFDHLGESGSGDTGANNERDALTFVSLTNKNISNSENTQAGLNGLVKALPEVARKNGGWFKGTGNLASVESSGTKAGFASETGGFMFGFDREVDKGVRIGAAGGYDHTSLSTFNGINASAETNSVRFALYGSKAFEDNIALDAQIGYALHMIDGDRFESNTGTTATNSHNANEYSTGFQLSKKFDVNGFTFKPKAGINYAHVDENGYTETGAGLFNTTIASKSINSLRLSTGFGISRHMKPRDGFAFTPEAHIKYSYEALDSTSATSGSQRGIGFVSTGVEPSHHILTTGIGFSATLDDDLSAFGNYDVNLPTGNSFEQTFTLGIRLSF